MYLKYRYPPAFARLRGHLFFILLLNVFEVIAIHTMASKIPEKIAETTSSSHEVSTATSIDIAEAEAQGFDAAATKKLVRKLDWHLIPFLALIYL